MKFHIIWWSVIIGLLILYGYSEMKIREQAKQECQENGGIWIAHAKQCMPKVGK